MANTSTDTSAADTTPSLAVPSWIVLGLLTLTPLIFATAFSSYEVLKEGVMVAGAGAALVAWAVGVIRQRGVTLMAGRLAAVAVALGLWALVSLGWSGSLLAGLFEALHFVALIALLLVVLAPVGRPLRFYDVAVAVALGSALSGLFGILDVGGATFITEVWDPPGATGPFDALTHAAAYYAVALPIVAAAVFRFAGKARIFFVACFLVAGVHFGLVASWTLAAVFAGACLLAALLLFGFQRALSGLVLTPIIVLLGALAVFVAFGSWAVSEPSVRSDATDLPRLMTSGAELAPGRTELRNPVFSTGRMEAFQDFDHLDYLFAVSGDLIDEQPVLGHGAGSWWRLQTKYPHIEHPFVRGRFFTYPAFRSPHNAAILLLVDYGAIGLVLFSLWVFAVLAVTLMGASRRRELSEWLTEHWALLSATLVGLAFMALTPFVELAPSALTWVVAVGLLTRLSATLNDFQGLSSVWSLRAESNASAGAWAMGALAGVLGLAIIAAAVAHTGSAYHRGLGDHLMLRTYFEDAAGHYEAADAWYPGQGDVLYNLALIKRRTSRFAEGVPQVNLAVEHRPYDTRVLTLLAQAHLRNDNFAEALKATRRAVATFPNNIEAVKAQGVVLTMMGRTDDATNLFLDMLERDPPSSERVDIHMRVAELYDTHRQDFARAVKHYEKAVELMPAGQARGRLSEKIKALEDRIEQQRRMREGKPPLPGDKAVPPGGGHQGHGHDHGGRPFIPPPARPPSGDEKPTPQTP